MRVVIADDEWFVQETLISMIHDWNDSWEIIGIASDGRELAQMIESLQPDLVIADIKMPYLTGLEAVSSVKHKHPSLQCIITSGYSEFAYAREALKLGAVNYLLKPIDIDELQSTLRIVQRARQDAVRTMNKKIESAVHFMSLGLEAGIPEEEARLLAKMEFHISIFYLDSGLPVHVQADRIQQFYEAVQQLLDHGVNEQFRYSFLYQNNGELAIIGVYNETNGPGVRWEDLTHRIEELMLRSHGNGFCLTMISAACDSYLKLKKTLEEIHQFAALRVLHGLNRHLSLHKLKRSFIPETYPFCVSIVALVKTYIEGSHANFMNEVNKLKESMDSHSVWNNKKYRQAIALYLNKTLGCRLNPVSHLGEWILQLKIHADSLLKTLPRSERPSDIVQQALLFIEKHYSEDLNIMQIADELHITPNYLSSIFHKKMEITIIKYITKLRMVKAQKLLTDTDLQIQEIAEKVGYSNPRYFSKLFLEYSQCLPSEYKRLDRNSMLDYSIEGAALPEQA